MSPGANIGKVAETAAQSMSPLKKRKNPLIAALLGFICGGIDVGIYLESVVDGLLCLAFGIAAALILPGPGLILGAAGAAVWGYTRAEASNKKLGA